MHPVIGHFGQWSIPTYGVFVSLGLILSVWLLFPLAKINETPVGPLLDLAIFVIVLGTIGSRASYVFFHWSEFQERPMVAMNFWQGGVNFYGGFLLAMPLFFLVLWKRKISFWKTTDTVAPALAFCHGMVKIGCFFSGCCYGNYCAYPWGIVPKAASEGSLYQQMPIHPVQLYEAVSLFALSALLLGLLRKRVRPAGSIGLYYVALSSAARFIFEFYREEASPVWHTLSLVQIIAGILFLGTSTVLLIKRERDLSNSHQG